MEEQWNAIPSAPDYEASSEGRIRRRVPDSVGRKPGILAQSTNSTGRAQVSICVDRRPRSRKVHRLVAEAFHGYPPESRPMVCHRDGNPLNNRPENLYYGTSRSNGQDAARHGTTASGARNGNSKLTTRKAKAIIAMRHLTSSEVSEKMGVHFSTICRIWRGETWRHLQR